MAPVSGGGRWGDATGSHVTSHQQRNTPNMPQWQASGHRNTQLQQPKNKVRQKRNSNSSEDEESVDLLLLSPATSAISNPSGSRSHQHHQKRPINPAEGRLEDNPYIDLALLEMASFDGQQQHHSFEQQAVSPSLNRSASAAADISKSRYLLQNKKLLEELESRTYELQSVKRQLKEVGGRHNQSLATIDQRIVALESEVRIQDKKLRHTEAKLANHQHMLREKEAQLTMAMEENEKLMNQLEALAHSKESLEKQRSDAIQNLEEMAKSMQEFRHHTKQKLDKSSEAEESLKKHISHLKAQVETAGKNLNEKVKELQGLNTQVTEYEQVLKDKDGKIQEMNDRLDSNTQENELLKESNKITSTDLSDVRIELETLKREHLAGGGFDQATREKFFREAAEMGHQLAAKDAEVTSLRLALSRQAQPSPRCDSQASGSRGENVAEPDLHDVAVLEADKSRLNKRIRELESSLKSKATELDSVKSQLALWSSQYDEAKNFINANDCLVMRLERDNQQKQRVIETCRREISDLKLKVENSKNECTNLESKIKQSQTDYHQLKTNYNDACLKAETTGKKLKECHEFFAQKEFEYQNHIDQLREELKESSSSIDFLNESLDVKDRTIKELQDHFDLMLPNLESVKGELTALNTAHVNLKEQSHQIQEEKRTQINHLENALKVYREEIEKMSGQFSKQREAHASEVEKLNLEIETLGVKIEKYENQISSANEELAHLDVNIKDVESQLAEKDTKLAELELTLAQTLKEKSDALEKHSEDTTQFEQRFADLQALYDSLNEDLKIKIEEISESRETVKRRDERLLHLENLCKENDSKMKKLIEQIETRTENQRILEKNNENLHSSVSNLQHEIDSRNEQIQVLSKELQTSKSKCAEIDKAFSDYYTSSQEVVKQNKALSETVLELQSNLYETGQVHGSMKKELGHVNEQVKVLQGLLQEKQIQHANKQQQVLELERGVQVARRERDDTNEALKETEAKLKVANSSNADLDHKVKMLESQLAVKEDQISMKEDKIVTLTKKLESVVKLDDTNTRRLEDFAKSLTDKSEEMSKVKCENMKLKEELSANEAELSKVYRQNSELEDSLKSRSEEISKLSGDKKSLAEEIVLKSASIDSLMTKVENYEAREGKLQVAVTEEIGRLKSMVKLLTEQHNEEVEKEHEKFKEVLSAKDAQLQRAIQEMQQFSFREQILRNDLAKAIEQLENNPGNMSSRSVQSKNGVYTVMNVGQGGTQVPVPKPPNQVNGNEAQHPQNGGPRGHVPGLLFTSGGPSSRFSSLTGTQSMDKALEIKSDPMLYNFHYLPNDQQLLRAEDGSVTSGATTPVSPASASAHLAPPNGGNAHQALCRTYSDSRQPPSPRSLKNARYTAVQEVESSNGEAEKKENGHVSGNSNKEPLTRQRSHSMQDFEVDVKELFRRVSDETSAPSSARTYKVPLTEGKSEHVMGQNGNSELIKESQERKSDKKRNISVQELSLVYNDDDELLNQSCHSITSQTTTHSHVTQGELDDVDSGAEDTPDTTLGNNETDEQFLKMMADNSERRKKLEKQLNLLVEQASHVTQA